MIIKELIKHLETLDPELSVYVRGYEGGVTDLTSISPPCEIALDVHGEWYYGEHEVVDEMSGDYESHEKKQGVVL